MKKMVLISLIVGVSIVFFILAMLPLGWMLITSLKGSKEILQYPPSFVPSNITIENYLNLFKESNFAVYLKNSLFVATCVVIITNTISTLGAYSLCRFNYSGKQIITVTSLLGYMIAPMMIVIPFYMVMRFFEVANTHIALILAHTAFCFPFALWLMKSYLADIPLELEKAAKVDGANQWQTLIYVVLPLCTPGITAVSIFTFILSWNDYVFARILITSDVLKTIPIGIEDIYNGTVVDWGMLMAAGIVVTLPVLAGFIVINKVLMKGWGYSGLKA